MPSEAPKMPTLPEPHAELPYGSYTFAPVIGGRSGTFPIFTADQMRAFYLSGWRAAREAAFDECIRIGSAFAAYTIRSMPDPQPQQPVHQTADSGEGRMSDAQDALSDPVDALVLQLAFNGDREAMDGHAAIADELRATTRAILTAHRGESHT